ncbi:MAG: prepilin-type N-terminal cleavage/methylation domain-containing protein [Candidatus Omnitrophica bacterium]|nr:prepilin-type N-terminal cleavage/methylation domain-containing protein [Candidatus Omnitrophota bacterium]
MDRNGFSMIEVLVAIAIMGVLFAIAIPNLVCARISAYETVALTSMKTISKAVQSWSVQKGSFKGVSLDSLANSNPPFIDSSLKTGYKSGYNFEITLGVPIANGRIYKYNINAFPNRYRSSGERSCLIDENGNVYAKDNDGIKLAEADKIPQNILN